MRKFTSALLLATTLLASFAAFATDEKKPEEAQIAINPQDVTAETPVAENAEDGSQTKK